MFESIFDWAGRAPLSILLILIGFVLLLLPAALQSLAPGSAVERAAGFVGHLFAGPSLLLSRVHNGDVRTYVMWIIIGAALLVAVGLASSGLEMSEILPGGK